MRWYHDVSYFFGALFLANFAPHFVQGVSGSPLQTPFASPAGQLSSSTTNVAWALANLAVAYLLLVRVGDFSLRRWRNALVFGAGFALGSMWLAQQLGRMNGGLL